MGRFFKVIFMAFGWIMIIVIVYHWSSSYYALSLAGYNVNNIGTRVDSFRGFGWFFDRIAQFPGFTPFYKGLMNWFKSVELNQTLSPDIMDLSGMELVVTILKYMVTPFYAIGLIIYNIALIIGWLFVWFV